MYTSSQCFNNCVLQTWPLYTLTFVLPIFVGNFFLYTFYDAGSFCLLLMENKVFIKYLWGCQVNLYTLKNTNYTLLKLQPGLLHSDHLLEGKCYWVENLCQAREPTVHSQCNPTHPTPYPMNTALMYYKCSSQVPWDCMMHWLISTSPLHSRCAPWLVLLSGANTMQSLIL